MYSATFAVSDVDNDGKLDVLVTSPFVINQCDPGIVSVLKGNGDGTLQTAKSFNSGGCSAGVLAVADVNGDGNPDVLVANGCISENNCLINVIGILRGNGDGTFQAAQTYSSSKARQRQF
jgi:hypothetical protein